MYVCSVRTQMPTCSRSVYSWIGLVVIYCVYTAISSTSSQDTSNDMCVSVYVYVYMYAYIYISVCVLVCRYSHVLVCESTETFP